MKATKIIEEKYIIDEATDEEIKQLIKDGYKHMGENLLNESIYLKMTIK